MDRDIEELREKLNKSETLVRMLTHAFETLKKVVANTLYGTKKIVQLCLLAGSAKYYGLKAFVVLFIGLLLVETVQMGYEKILEIKPT